MNIYGDVVMDEMAQTSSRVAMLALYGDQSEELAQALDGEAELYKAVGDYGHAEPLLVSSLEMRRKLLPADNAEIAESENDLGELYTLTGAYQKAEPLLLEAFSMRQKLGQETADVAQSYEALAFLYKSTGRPKDAEQSFRQAVSIYGKTLGGEHPDYANALENLALVTPAASS
jgi:tetratricopeptide (TPR) repeat protein